MDDRFDFVIIGAGSVMTRRSRQRHSRAIGQPREPGPSHAHLDRTGRPRDRDLDAVWGTDFLTESNIVDRHIRSLRVKLQDDYRHPRFIATVPGQGYRFIPTFTNIGWGAGYDQKEPPSAARR